MFGRKPDSIFDAVILIFGKFKNFKSDIFIVKITCALAADKPLLCIRLMSNNGDSAVVCE